MVARIGRGKPRSVKSLFAAANPFMADDDHSSAYTAETALERAARHARERGGYTVRLDSRRAEEARNHD
jgi:hypothetical protein